MGGELMRALDDPLTAEILLNADGRLWQECLGESMRCIGTLPLPRAQAIIKTVAGYHGRVVTQDIPLVEGAWPLGGARFSGQIPPVVVAPTFAIRKKARQIFSLDHYVEKSHITARQRTALEEAVAERHNILVFGGSGSGKTTFVNALILRMVTHEPQARLVLIEDTGELQCPTGNHVQYCTTPAMVEGWPPCTPTMPWRDWTG